MEITLKEKEIKDTWQYSELRNFLEKQSKCRIPRFLRMVSRPK